MQRQSGINAIEHIDPIASGAYYLPDPHDMHTGLSLGIGVFDEADLGACGQTLDVGQVGEVVDPLAAVLQVETCVLKSAGLFDYGGSKILNLAL